MEKGREYWNLKIDETKSLFQKRPNWMRNFDNDFPSAAFIKGLINEHKPENMLEIGTAAGWAAYYMLEEAHKYSKKAVLTSIDIAENIYYAPEKKIGAAFYETAPGLAKFWNLRTNTMPVDYMSDCGQKFDFVFIDASHFHPWAALDLLVVLPHLAENAVIVFHDVFLNKISKGLMPADRHPDNIVCGKEKFWGPNAVYSAFQEKMILSYDDIAPNCAAIRACDISIEKILESLNTKWETGIFDFNGYNKIASVINKILKNLEFTLNEAVILKLEEILKFRLNEAFEAYQRKQQKIIAYVNQKIKGKKCVFWGASLFLEEILAENLIDISNVAGIVDINGAKQGKLCHGLMIYPPEYLRGLNAELIFSSVATSPKMGMKIRKTLENIGFSDDIAVDDGLFKCFQNFED